MEHLNAVNNLCDNLVNILNKCADEYCGNVIHNCKKVTFNWSDDLKKLKQQSVDIHNLWKLCGKPHYGVINQECLCVKSNYHYFCRSNAMLRSNLHLCYLFLKKAYMDFCGLLWIFASHYGSITHPLDVTVYANTEIVGQHRHYRATLIVINFYYLQAMYFLSPSEFELGSIKLKR